MLEGGVTEIDLADAVRGADGEIEVEFIVELTAEAKPVFTAQVLTWACGLFEGTSLG
ncbi:hypothetical protein [Streptosporangium sp. V21-05]|uniref:hypothetical protein n=1 Tax=Streptosporangium sp. V21-05 TaxID=3446115 RepID=UPI003F52DE86